MFSLILSVQALTTSCRRTDKIIDGSNDPDFPANKKAQRVFLRAFFGAPETQTPANVKLSIYYYTRLGEL